jgi:hypothetical protein
LAGSIVLAVDWLQSLEGAEKKALAREEKYQE